MMLVTWDDGAPGLVILFTQKLQKKHEVYVAFYR
jgi:hypothetical protein